ncbi:MAG: non-heme iron oxygenase ferredoxin subunit [Chloroflexi bacterium]|nr:non-heme iron oxygenase ferredoxin subunit [Chloroflexota bacterium]MBV9602328.1 non-heme iron oxygenase ferredoxin subunit [Chloroflexota bacterium]
MTTWQSVGQLSEIPPERVAVFHVGDHEVAVCNVNGQLYAIDDLCTHDGGSLDQGELEGDEIECPRHGARFNVTTGEAIQLPAFEPVETHEVRLEGDTVQVGVEHR